MSNESRSSNRKDKELRIPLRQSRDTIPPQTGRFRNLFEEMQNSQSRPKAGSQTRLDSDSGPTRRDNSDG